MPYPTFVMAALVEIDGESCGSLSHRLEFDSTASPPAYNKVGSGDFIYAKCWRTDLGGGNYTWDLKLRYTGAGPCNGLYNFRLSTAADDPVGPYCIYSSGNIDCAAGKAGVIDDD